MADQLGEAPCALILSSSHGDRRPCHPAGSFSILILAFVAASFVGTLTVLHPLRPSNRHPPSLRQQCPLYQGVHSSTAEEPRAQLGKLDPRNLYKGAAINQFCAYRKGGPSPGAAAINAGSTREQGSKLTGCRAALEGASRTWP